MNQPTPEEAAAALRTVQDGRQRVIRSALGARWLSIASGLLVFLYSAANDLFPSIRVWLNVSLLAIVVVLVFGLHTRFGNSLIGRPVMVSNRSLSLSWKWRALRIAPLLAVAVGVSLVINLLHLPHGGIWYGALAGLYIIFLGPRFQLWLLRRRDED